MRSTGSSVVSMFDVRYSATEIKRVSSSKTIRSTCAGKDTYLFVCLFFLCVFFLVKMEDHMCMAQSEDHPIIEVPKFDPQPLHQELLTESGHAEVVNCEGNYRETSVSIT